MNQTEDPIAYTAIPDKVTRNAHAAFASDPAARIAKNAVSASPIRKVARVPEALSLDASTFDVQLSQGDITNQKRSGRCWMFASLNTMRFRIMKKLNLKTFELSQAYPLFWDKYERANWFFQNIIATANEPVTSRDVSFLLLDPLCDGGQWDMFRSIVKKYGVVPKDAMPETHCSSNTGDMDAFLTRFLRAGAKALRDMIAGGAGKETLAAKQAELLEQFYRMLAICLGEPPKSFEARIRDKDDKLVVSGTFSPKQFFDEYVGMTLDDYISVINAPTEDKPFFKSYSVSYLGNVKEGRPVKYVNLPIEELKKAAIAQMQDGEPVWFGCDVGKRGSRTGGILDLDIYDLDGLFGTHFGMNKAERLEYGQSQMTHAMVFQGVNLDENGNPNRWRVENSWGEDACKDGYYVMSDRWFEEYTYQIVVNKKYLPKEVVEIFESEPIMLEPWDPMGSLAR